MHEGPTIQTVARRAGLVAGLLLMAEFVSMLVVGAEPASAGPLAAAQGSGKVVVSTTHHGRPALIRFKRNGAIDRDFGDHGFAQVGYGRGNQITGLLTQSHGLIDLVSYPVCQKHACNTPVRVTQMRRDGRIDSTFGRQGHARAFVTSTGAAGELTRSPDGDLFVVGHGSPPPSVCAEPVCPLEQDVAKLGSGGGLDTGFGDGGVMRIVDSELSPYAFTGFNAVALTPDGRVLAGGSPLNSLAGDAAIARFLPDGSLDPSFAGDGVIETHTPVDDLFVDDQGRTVFGGAVGGEGSPQRFGTARVKGDGSVDLSFAGGTGAVSRTIGEATRASGALVRGSDHGLLIAGTIAAPCLAPNGANPTCRTSIGLLGYTAEGAVEPSFGRAGVVKTSTSRFIHGPSSFDRVDAFASDGRFLVAAPAYYGVPVGVVSTPMLARYRSDGSLDRHFGRAGRVRAPIDWCPGTACPSTRLKLHGTGSRLRLQFRVAQPRVGLHRFALRLPERISVARNRARTLAFASADAVTLPDRLIAVHRHRIAVDTGGRRVESIRLRLPRGSFTSRTSVAGPAAAFHLALYHAPGIPAEHKRVVVGVRSGALGRPDWGRHGQ